MPACRIHNINDCHMAGNFSFMTPHIYITTLIHLFYPCRTLFLSFFCSNRSVPKTKKLSSHLYLWTLNFMVFSTTTFSCVLDFVDLKFPGTRTSGVYRTFSLTFKMVAQLNHEVHTKKCPQNVIISQYLSRSQEQARVCSYFSRFFQFFYLKFEACNFQKDNNKSYLVYS